MNMHAGPPRCVLHALAVVAVLALGSLGLPAHAAGGIWHMSHPVRAQPTDEISAFPPAVVADSHWVVHSDAGRFASDRDDLAVDRGELAAHGPATFTGGALGEAGGAVDYSGHFRRHGSGYWPEHGGLEDNGLDEGHLDDDHFCDGRCVPYPEPAIPVLALTGVAMIFFMVRRRRMQGG
jgi:hypothetical protein